MQKTLTDCQRVRKLAGSSYGRIYAMLEKLPKKRAQFVYEKVFIDGSFVVARKYILVTTLTGQYKFPVSGVAGAACGYWQGGLHNSVLIYSESQDDILLQNLFANLLKLPVSSAQKIAA